MSLATRSLLLISIGVVPITQSHSQRLVRVPISIFGQPVSIETGPELQTDHDGFLECANRLLVPNRRNGNTKEAVNNVVSPTINMGNAMIVGHGAPGVICTGDGDSCNGLDEKMVASWNESAWRNLLQSLRGHFASLTLLGCDTGQDPTFLSEVAQIADMPVKAPNSIIMCDDSGILLAQGGSFVRSGDAAALSVGPRFSVRPARFYSFWQNQRFVQVAPENVQIVAFKHQGYRERELREFRSDLFPSALQLIDFGHPVKTRARPAAVHTGDLIVRFTAEGVERTESFALFNDELLEDISNPNVFYFADSSFGKFIADAMH